MEFPSNRNCGELLICRDPVERNGITWVLGNPKFLAMVKGQVAYPPSKFLRMNIPRECSGDLSFLNDLPEDAINELWIGSASANC